MKIKKYLLVIMMIMIASMSFGEEVTTNEAIYGDDTVSTVNWVYSGEVIDVGELANLDLDSEMVFLNGDDTRIYQESEFQNFPTNQEIGSIYPKSQEEKWFVVIEYNEDGYVKDNEKINEKKLLKGFKKGEEEYAKEHPEFEKTEVLGWEQLPKYDKEKHIVTWSVLYKMGENGIPYANHNTKILVRRGYLSFILVADKDEMDMGRKILNERILSKFAIREGNRYSDFNKKEDKVAKYGLTGLILGGVALAALKKGGLLVGLLLVLKKFGIIVIAALAFFFKRIKTFFSKKEEISEAKSFEKESAEPDSESKGDKE